MATQYTDGPGPSRVRSYPHLRPTPSIPFAPRPQTASLRPPTFESGSAPVLESVISSWQRYATVAGRQRNVSSPLDLEGRREAMDNWQLLREVVEDGVTPVAGLRPKRSLSPLRQKIGHGPSTQPSGIRVGRTGYGDQITDQLSSSPPGMNGFEGDDEAETNRGIEEVLERPNVPPERRPLLPRKISATRAASIPRARKADPPPRESQRGDEADIRTIYLREDMAAESSNYRYYEMLYLLPDRFTLHFHSLPSSYLIHTNRRRCSWSRSTQTSILSSYGCYYRRLRKCPTSVC